MSERAEFEESYAGLGDMSLSAGWNNFDTEQGKYSNISTDMAWSIWKAAQSKARNQLALIENQKINFDQKQAQTDIQTIGFDPVNNALTFRAFLAEIKYALEKSRVWSGMDWRYNPLPSIHYKPVIAKIEKILAEPISGQEVGFLQIDAVARLLLSREVLDKAALAVEESADVWTGFAINDAKTCIAAAIEAIQNPATSEDLSQKLNLPDFPMRD